MKKQLDEQLVEKLENQNSLKDHGMGSRGPCAMAVGMAGVHSHEQAPLWYSSSSCSAGVVLPSA